MPGLPTLVMLAPDASLINRAAKDRISSPERFPWLPPTVEEALGDLFLNQYGDRVRLRSSLLGGSHVALFFASPSLGACKVFAPALAEAMARARADGAGLEIVYIPSGPGDDTDPGSAREAVSRLVGPAVPWLTIPADANPHQRVAQLKTLFNVGQPRGSAPPVLVLLDSSLAVVNPDAVRSVSAGEPFPWRPRLVWDAARAAGRLARAAPRRRGATQPRRERAAAAAGRGQRRTAGRGGAAVVGRAGQLARLPFAAVCGGAWG